MKLNNNLKSFRHEMKMNQTEFWTFLEVNKDQYGRWEHQKVQPSLEWCWILSKKLNCHIEDLFHEV